MTLAEETGPIPSQLVNDSRTEPIAGTHTSHTTRIVGTTTMRMTTRRSTPDSWLIPLYLVRVATLELLRRSIRILAASAREDALLLLLDVVHQAVDVLRVLDEGLDRGDHH